MDNTQAEQPDNINLKRVFSLVSEPDSRSKILAAVKQNQPPFVPLPVMENFAPFFTDVLDKFKTTVLIVGGYVQEVENIAAVITILKGEYAAEQRVLSVMEEFADYAEIYQPDDDPHKLNNVDVAIIKAQFGVAENGAIWVTENKLRERVLPFICQHLVAVLDVKDIVATMHDAYDVIGAAEYGFGTFIAGPSKTADIEQSLVLGAHGPKTMTVFIVI